MIKKLDFKLNNHYNCFVMKYTVKFINESASDANLIELTGSPKQIAWANDIRKSVVEILLKDYSPESVYQIVNKIKNAKYWIDRQYEIPSDIVQKIRYAEVINYYKKFRKQKSVELFIPNDLFVGLEEGTTKEDERYRGGDISCFKFSFYSPIDYIDFFQTTRFLKNGGAVGAVVDIFIKSKDSVTFTEDGAILKLNKNDWFQILWPNRTNGKKLRRIGMEKELDITVWSLFVDIANKINEAVGY